MKVTLAENGGRVTAKAESGERQDIAVLCVTQISGAAQYVVVWVPPINPHNQSKTRVWKSPETSRRGLGDVKQQPQH